MTNVSILPNVPFESYIKWTGWYSHSWLKKEAGGIAEGVRETNNIRVGATVDAILTEPDKVDMRSLEYTEAKRIADLISKEFSLKGFDKQLSFSAELEHEGFVLPVKGRLDYAIQGSTVADLKVTWQPSKRLTSLIDFMGYDNQLWLYAKAIEANKAYIIFHCVKEKKTVIHNVNIPEKKDFWEEKIFKFGNVRNKKTNLDR